MGIISGLGSFRGQFGDHFRVGDHFGVGIISGAVHLHSAFASVLFALMSLIVSSFVLVTSSIQFLLSENKVKIKS